MGWIGAGGGMARASSEVSTRGAPALTGTSWVPSAHASASYGLPLGPGIPFLEIKGTWQGEASSGPVRGSLTSATLSLGYRFAVR